VRGKTSARSPPLFLNVSLRSVLTFYRALCEAQQKVEISQRGWPNPAARSVASSGPRPVQHSASCPFITTAGTDRMPKLLARRATSGLCISSTVTSHAGHSDPMDEGRYVVTRGTACTENLNGSFCCHQYYPFTCALRVFPLVPTERTPYKNQDVPRRAMLRRGLAGGFERLATCAHLHGVGFHMTLHRRPSMASDARMGQSLIAPCPGHASTRCVSACFITGSVRIFSSTALILARAR
jgi:hypothetical protein